LRLGYRITR